MVKRNEFLRLAEFEPELLKLESDIKKHSKENRNTEDYCANMAWYRDCHFKKRMCELVGDYSKNPMLRGNVNYEKAYDYLYNLLPDCNHKGGIC